MVDYDLVLEGISKTFGSVVAVDNFSLKLEKGTFVSFIGPSGCGKTTTLRTIAGLEWQDSGSVYIRGRKVDDLPPWKRNTSMVFQDFALFPHLTVGQNIGFGLRIRGLEKKALQEKVGWAAAKVGLEGLLDSNVEELSSGQRQRVGVARALVTEPDLLLLDEPLGSVDASLRASMQAELTNLQRELGIGFIHVTHDQSEALAMADLIVVMNEGKAEQIGSPEEVFYFPKTKFVASFVGKNNILDGEILSVEGDTVLIGTDLGIFRAQMGEKRLERKKVSFVVRAANVQEGSTQDNSVTGVLKGVEYAGTVVTCVLALPNGQEVQMEKHESLVRHLVPRLGEELVVGWEASDVYILPS